MPRLSISTGFRNSMEEPDTAELPLVFATIEHDDLDAPIRVVNDAAMPVGRNIEYLRDGITFIGCPFELSLLSDDERPPRGQVQIQNVDGVIGRTIDSLLESPSITLEILRGADFVRQAAPNNYIWAADDVEPEIRATHLRLENITVDTMVVSADIVSWDLTREPWGVRATKGKFPGLYW